MLYETPGAKRGRKAISGAIYLVYAAIVISLFLSGVFWRTSWTETILLSVFVPVVLFIIFSSIALRFLDTSFKVYEEGITEPLSEMMSAFRKEGRFVLYSKMKAFEVYGGGSRAILHLTGNRRVHFASRNRATIEALRKHLLRHDVREVQDTCQSCGKRVYGQVCPECGTKRF